MAISRQTLRLIRDLRVTVGTEADDATRALTNAWARAWKELDRAFRDGVTDVVALAAQLDRWPRAWELQRVERLRVALTASQEALAQLAEATGVTVTDAAGNAIKATAEAEPRVLSSQLPATERAAATATFAGRLPASVLDVLVERTTRQITATSRPLSGAAYEAMQRQLLQGVAVGDNPRETARKMVARVQGAFDGGLTRANTIARTETIDAMRGASRASHTANRDVVKGWQWLCALDKRSCPACWAMHGSEHAVSEPGPLGHQQCVVAGAVVAGPRALASTTRWFRGEVVDVETDGGHLLTVTPNHPVLTPDGWIDAGQLREGSYVVCGEGHERPSGGGNPDDYQVPAFIEDVAETLGGSPSVSAVTVPTAAEDFHGDGVGSKVHVVRTDRLLWDRADPAFAEPAFEASFRRGTVSTHPFLARLAPLGAVDAMFPALRSATDGGMRCPHEGGVFLAGSSFGNKAVRLGNRASIDSSVIEAPVDHLARYAEPTGDAFAGFTRHVSPDNLISGYLAAADHRTGLLPGGHLAALFGGTPEAPLYERALQECLAGVMTTGDDLATFSGDVVGNRQLHHLGGLATRESSDAVGGPPQEAAGDQLPAQSGVPYAVPTRDGLERFARNVGSYRVLKVRRRQFAGHVYNLQTGPGWYLANGIVTHNCRCTRVALMKTWRDLGIDLDEPPSTFPDAKARFDAMPKADQVAVMGHARLDLLRSGQASWDDLAVRRSNPDWRPSYAPRPLADLRRTAD